MEAESFDHAGMHCRIMYDDMDDSPRDWVNLGTILYGSSRYKLGDVEVSEHERDYEAHYGRPADSWQDWARYAVDVLGATVVLPVYAYIHSGVTVRAGESMDAGNPYSCPWDSGCAGIVFDTPEGRQATGVDGKDVADTLRSEVATFDQYLTGDVYGYVVEDEDGCEVDSCWGFYGLDYCMQQARESAEYEAARLADESVKIDRCMRL